MPYAVLVERTIPVPRQRVFAALMDFGGVGTLSAGGTEKVECVGEGVGAVRTVHIRGLPTPVVERLDVAHDGRVFAYSIINETALPLERYIAVVELDDAPDGGCRVRWGSNWVAKGAPEAEIKPMLSGLYNKIIDSIEKQG